MNTPHFLKELLLPIILVILVILFLDPFMVLMPASLVYFLIVALVVFFALFASFLWRERASDEREQLHKLVAGRLGYLAGTGVLVIGIVIEALFVHTVDPWLVVALATMIFGKLAGLLYSRTRL